MKLVSIIAVTLVLSASAYAQSPPGSSSGRDTVQRALRDPDPVRRDERLISISHSNPSNSSSNSSAWRNEIARSFKGLVFVENHSGLAIKSVSWVASLTDPQTGALIRTYDVTTKTRIAPGKSKVLTRKFTLPISDVVNADKIRRVANLTSTITGITYEDGSTASAP
jgi:hypothetical protein